MESWRRIWRDGIAPSLSTAGLEALRRGLAEDDECLLQHQTTYPPSMVAYHEAAKGACAVGYCGWRGEGLETTGAVGTHFRAVLDTARAKLGDVLDTAANVQPFLDWYDNGPRAKVFRELLAEVDRELQSRAKP